MELILILLCSSLLYYECKYYINKQPNIIIRPKSWKHSINSNTLYIEGRILMINPNKKKEIRNLFIQPLKHFKL